MPLPSCRSTRGSSGIGAIFRRVRARATALVLVALAAGCGGRKPPQASPETGLTAPRVLDLTRTIALETSGPPPSDTSVTFRAGDEREIVLRHGPPENILFANLSFGPNAFADSGQTVRVDVHPRPGLYGLEFSTSLPLRPSGATLEFAYARFFSAPAQARQVYGSDVVYERALAVGRLLTNNRLELLPSSRPAADVLQAGIPGTGTYLVAAPQ